MVSGGARSGCFGTLAADGRFCGLKAALLLLSLHGYGSAAKMDCEKDQQNPFTENQNRSYAIVERNSWRTFHPVTSIFKNRGGSAIAIETWRCGKGFLLAMAARFERLDSQWGEGLAPPFPIPQHTTALSQPPAFLDKFPR